MTVERNREVEDLLKRGEKFLRFNEIEAAKESFKQALKIDESSAKGWYLLGVAHRDGKEFDKARDCLKKAISNDPDWIVPLETLGTMEFSLNNPRETVKHLKKYMEKEGNNLDTLLTLARAAFETEDCKNVLSVTGKINDQDDSISQVWVMRGICQAKLDRFNAACTSLTVALELDPGSISALNTVGELSYKAGNYPVAIELYTPSFQQNKEQPVVLYRLGVSHWLIENWSAAIPYLESYVKMEPNDPKGWNNLGVVLREKGEVKRAMECYSKALSLDSTLDIVRKNMATAKEKQMIL